MTQHPSHQDTDTDTDTARQLDDAELSEATGGASLVLNSTPLTLAQLPIRTRRLTTISTLGSFDLPEISPLPILDRNGPRLDDFQIGKVGGGKGGTGVGIKF